MAFIQAPIPVDWDPHQAQFVQGDPQSPNGARQHGGEGDVEGTSVFLQSMAGGQGLCSALSGKIHIGPAGKAVLSVPEALPMAKEDECSRSGCRVVIPEGAGPSLDADARDRRRNRSGITGSGPISHRKIEASFAPLNKHNKNSNNND